MFPEKLKQLRKQSNMSQDSLAKALNEKYDMKISKSMISRWENGSTDPQMKYVRIIAHFFNLDPSELVSSPHSVVSERLQEYSVDKTDTISNTISLMQKLKSDRQLIVYDCAKAQLSEQNKPKIKVRSIDDHRETISISVQGAVSAGTGEYIAANDPMEYEVKKPIPKYDFAVIVNGDSMLPLLDDKQIIFVRKPIDLNDVRANQIVIAEYEGNAYVKKLVINSNDVRLVSLNPEYDDIVIEDFENFVVVGVVII